MVTLTHPVAPINFVLTYFACDSSIPPLLFLSRYWLRVSCTITTLSFSSMKWVNLGADSRLDLTLVAALRNFAVVRSITCSEFHHFTSHVIEPAVLSIPGTYYLMLVLSRLFFSRSNYGWLPYIPQVQRRSHKAATEIWTAAGRLLERSISATATHGLWSSAATQLLCWKNIVAQGFTKVHPELRDCASVMYYEMWKQCDTKFFVGMNTPWRWWAYC